MITTIIDLATLAPPDPHQGHDDVDDDDEEEEDDDEDDNGGKVEGLA